VPVPARVLDSGEEVLADLHPHWWVFAAPTLLSVACGAVALAVMAHWSPLPPPVAWILVALVGGPVLWLVVRAVRWARTSVAVTNSRLLVVQGVIQRDITSVRFERMAAVHRRARGLDRIVGTGHLVIELRDGAGFVTLVDVRHPKALQNVLQRQIAAGPDPGGGLVERGPEVEASLAYTPPHGVPIGGPAETVRAQLLALEDLRRRGIVTEEEFAVKKTELLSRL
jgi:membrane protein YdbS with pleckstrin-like domain